MNVHRRCKGVSPPSVSASAGGSSALASWVTYAAARHRLAMSCIFLAVSEMQVAHDRLRSVSGLHHYMKAAAEKICKYPACGPAMRTCAAQLQLSVTERLPCISHAAGFQNDGCSFLQAGVNMCAS